MSKRWIVPVVLFAAGLLPLLLPWGCADLPPVTQNQCGNGVVELPNDEDCDTLGVALDGGVTDGGNACSSTCRVLCSDAGACPWGWGCGSDGLCRRPGGTFAATGVQLTENVKRLLTADVDGDKKSEIIVDTGDELEVHYLGADDNVAHTIALVTPSPTPAVGDFDPDGGDGIADIAYRLDTAVTVLKGARDQTLSPAAFPVPLPTAADGGTGPDLSIPSNERFIAVNATSVDADVFKLKELLRLDPDAVTTFVPDQTGKRIQLADAGSAVLPDPTSPVPVAKFDEFATCDQFVLADKNAGTVGVYFSCGTDGMWNGPVASATRQAKMIGFTDGAKPSGPAFAVDVDGDGHMDLAVVAAVGNTEMEVSVAYGDGTGRFGSTRINGPAWVADDMAAPHLCLSRMRVADDVDAGQGDAGLGACTADVPLALADFDGDRVLDVVNPCGVFLSRKELPTIGCGDADVLAPVATSEAGLSGALWTRALVADLNGDGVPDVAAASCEDTSITYLEGSSAGIFNTYTIPTLAGVDDLLAGDFDGDHVGDLAYVERGGDSPKCPSGTTKPAATQSLGVIFGAKSGGPSAPSVLARFSGLGQVVPGFLTSTIGQFDFVTDLAAVYADPENSAVQQLDVFQGSTNREIIAPYFLVSPTTHEADLPWLVAMGHFGDPKAPAGLAVAAVESDMAHAELWILTQDDGVLESTTPVPFGDIVPTDYTGGGATKSAWLSALDLGGPPGDELVALSTDGDAQDAELYVASFQNGKISGPPVQTDLQGDYAGPIVAGDVDAQTGDDMVLTGPKAGVIVIWNDGSGAAAVGGAAKIASADLNKVCYDAGDTSDFVAATIVRAAPGLPRQIVFLTENHAYLASLDAASPGKHSFKVTCLDTSLPPPSGGFTGAVMASGDVDGDGVEDLVIGRAGTVQVYKGVAVVR